MITNMIFKGAKTDEEYAAVLRKRKVLFVILIFAGLVAVVLGIVLGAHMTNRNVSFLSGLYCGIGAGMIAEGIINIIKMNRILKDAGKIRAKRMKENDERNIMIKQKAFSSAGIMVAVVAYAVLLISGFFSMEVFWSVWGVYILFFILFLAFYIYYNKKL